MTRFRSLLFALILAAALWLDPLWLPLVPVALFMPVFAMNDPCPFYSDSYGTNTIGSYTAVSGSWSVGSGQLHLSSSSSANSVLIYSTALAGSSGYVEANVILSGNSSGVTTKGRIIGAYTDSNNYIFFEHELVGTVSSNYRLYKRVSGTNTQLGSTISVSPTTTGTMKLCWDGTKAVAVTPGLRVIMEPCTVTGSQAGVGGDPDAGGFFTAAFDDFVIRPYDAATCVTCNPCTRLNDGTTPRQVQIDSPTITNSGCTDCANTPTTWICDFYGFISAGSWGNTTNTLCQYRGTGTATVCSGSRTFTMTATVGASSLSATLTGYPTSFNTAALSITPPIDGSATQTLTGSTGDGTDCGTGVGYTWTPIA